MALWGKQDAAAPSNGTTVSVTNGSTAVSGSGTTFLSDIKNGDTLVINSGTVTKARVLSVTSNTALVLADNFAGTTNASLAIANVKIQQAPKFVYQDSNHIGIGQVQGVAVLPNVYGVDTTEIKVGGDNVVSVAVANAGARYIATDNSSTLPTVSFSGGGGSSAAASVTLTAGAVSAVTLSNGGSSYTSAPTVAITKPRRTVATTGINIGTSVITYTGHLLVAGDVVTYNNGGGASATGLTSGNTYYVIAANLTANAFQVSTTAGGTAVSISGTGNNAQYFELQGAADAATAVADLGSGSHAIMANPGWVRRTVGTGGRAGRIQYEVLVAGRSLITGDDATTQVAIDMPST
jgi:hypothetical protein